MRPTMYQLLVLVPGPPIEFTGTSNSSKTIILSWNPPLLIHYLANYTIQCFTEGEKALKLILRASQTTTTVEGLIPNTNYSCSIIAYSSVGGKGSPANTSVNTLKIGEQTHACSCTYITTLVIISTTY